MAQLIVLVMILANGKGFFTQFNAAIRAPVTPTATGASGAGAAAPAVSSSNFLGSAVPDILTGAPA